MDRVGRSVVAGLLLLPVGGAAQGSSVFCIPNTQACFSATLGFVPSPANPFYRNRLTSLVTNLQGTYGGLNAPFGFLGLAFVPRWNANVDPRATLGWFDLPDDRDKLMVNALAPGFDFDQPGGGTGYMVMRGSGYLGCTRHPGDGSWTFAGCPPDGRGGGVQFGLDLAFFSLDGSVQPATFRHFALRALTTAGSCTFTPSRWLLERVPSDACEERTVTTAAVASASVTPEPATLLLASGLAGAGMGARRMRRRSRVG